VPATLALLCCIFLSPATRAASPITAAAFSPDGDAAVVASQQGLAVHSWPDLRALKSLTTRLPHVHDLAFSPDGKTLAVAGGAPAEHGAVEFLSWPEGRPLSRSEPHTDLVYDFSWRPDEGWITAGIDGLVQVFDKNGQRLHQLTGHARGVLAAVMLPDERTLCTASIDHSVRVWEVEKGRPVRTMDQHTGPVVGLALRPAIDPAAQPMLASIAEDRTVRLWQPAIGRLVRFARLESPPLAVAWTPDGRRIIVSCRDGHVRVLDGDSVQVLFDQAAIEGWAHTLAVAPDGGACLVGGADGQLRRIELPVTARDR
jgi:WD40 repeat protein